MDNSGCALISTPLVITYTLTSFITGRNRQHARLRSRYTLLCGCTGASCRPGLRRSAPSGAVFFHDPVSSPGMGRPGVFGPACLHSLFPRQGDSGGGTGPDGAAQRRGMGGERVCHQPQSFSESARGVGGMFSGLGRGFCQAWSDC